MLTEKFLPAEAGEFTYAFLPQALLGWQNGQQRAKRVGGRRPLAPADICFANEARCAKKTSILQRTKA